MRSIIQHLRFPFSYLLLPVFLLAIAFIPLFHFNLEKTLLLFFILHLLVYPSSNAFNSYQDKDEGSIGLVKEPLPIHNSLNWISAAIDCLAVALATLLSTETALYILIYILASRLYSYRKLRLKKYPILGFLVVFIFQGFWIYYLTIDALSPEGFTHNHYYFAFAASCLIGSIYPLSQIYQHEQDKADGVKTISYMLGKKGTFIFSGIFFLIGSLLIIYTFNINDNINYIIAYIIFLVPSLIYFNYWFYRVTKDENEANFKHTMRMSLISATCMNAFFILILWDNFTWQSLF